MEQLRVKLSGLTEADNQAFLSLLNMASQLLTADWQPADEDQVADLEVFCFNSAAGISAWQRRSLGCYSALLTTQGNLNVIVDVILKKPLRASQLSAALNLIEQKIFPPQQVPHIEQRYVFREPLAVQWLLLTFPFSTLSAKVQADQARPVANLPKLDFKLPPHSQHKIAETLLNLHKTSSWLNAVPQHPFQHIELLAKRIDLISQFRLPVGKGLQVLALYLSSLKDLLFERNTQTLLAEQHENTAQQQAIGQLSDALARLALCYLRLAQHFYRRGAHPAQHPLYLYSLNQASEVLVLSVINAFHHYRHPPRGNLKQLHQIYLYQEHATTLDLCPEFKPLKLVPTFKQLYTTLLLVGITDPYSLKRFAALRLYRQFSPLSSQAEITLLTEQQIAIRSDFLLSGHFCIATDVDKLPAAMYKTSQHNRAAKRSRLLNVQPVIKALIQNSTSSKKQNRLTHQLIEQILPQLNASYERRYHRLPLAQPRQLLLNTGLQAIHSALLQTDCTSAEQWHVLNESEQGAMLMCQQPSGTDQYVSQLVLMTEADGRRTLATVEWLCIDQRQQVQIGLEILAGTLVAAYCTADGTAHQSLILQLDSGSSSKLITEKGVYSPQRKLRLKTPDSLILIETEQLLHSSLGHECFRYRLLQVL